MFRVISTFADLLDNNYVYNEGAEYPHKGYSPSSERIEELSTNKNRLHKPLIQLVDVQEHEPEPIEEEVVDEPVEEPEMVEEEPVEKPTRGRKKKDVSNAE